MPSAGELLRNERVKRNRSLAEIAGQTCISRRYLEAIEVDRVTDLPGDFFYRSFLRQYAKALELDETATAEVLAAAVPISTADPVPALHEIYERKDEVRTRRWTAPTGVAILLLILVLVVTSGLYALWQRYQARSVAPQAVSSSSPTQSEPVMPQVTKPVPEEVRVADPGRIDLSLSATERTWVSVSSDSETVYMGILEPEQTRQFTLSGSAKIVTGNASGLNVVWNGKPIGPVGPRGQVRTVLFTADTFNIIAPRPNITPASDTP
jgi:cytoskeletal protein RodZ